MSVLSTLALLVTTAAVRPKADRTAEFEAEIAGLKDGLADARRALDHALSERDALREELERRLLRHGEHPLQQIPAGPDFRPPMPLGGQHVGQLAQQNALQQAVLGHLQQNQAVMQQQYVAMQNAQCGHQGLAQQLGAQNLQALDPEMVCNCVPSRAQVWAARNDVY